MEVEVRRVPGIKDCYAALPLALIQALQAGSSDAALSYVVLELRQKDKDPWYLAWAGAASSSPTAIEVSKKLAECIGLPDRARVFVKAQTHVAHAKTVVLEPATEDDWEILELNAGFVEDHILSQVGVLCSGQLFPIRVQGENILTLHVISTLPKQVVRLVPGAELIVAPKPRKKLPRRPSRTKANGNASSVESSTVKAWLRIQDIEMSLAQTVESEECLFSIVPTTSIFVSPETARNIGFIDGQLVVIAPPDGQGAKQKADSEKKQNQKSSAKPAGKMDDHKRQIVLRLVYCSKVTRGHAMIASTLRLFIGAAIHTYIEVRSVTETPCPLYPRVILSPLDFKVEEAVSGDSSINNHIKNEAKEDTSYLGNNIRESEKHQQFLSIPASLTDVSKGMGKLSESVKANILFKSWATAELAAVSQCSSGHCSSIPISKETVMQFCIRPTKDTFFFSHNYSQSSLLKSSKKLKKENFRVLSFLISLQRQEPSQRVDLQASMAESPKSFEGLFLLDKELMDKDGLNAEDMPGKYLNVIIGEPCQIASSFKKDPEENMVPSLDSLKWLKGPALQALKRLQVLLSTEAQEKRQKMGLASPGYVLLHGPAASGKSRLALALARELEEDHSILAHKIMVKCRELGGEQVQTVRTAFQDTVCEALGHAPSLIILDDLDALIPSNTNSQDNEPSSTTVTLTEFLSDLLDTFQVCGRNQHGGAVVFLALAQAVSSLPPSLCSSGRFDFHVELPVPAVSERAAILLQELDQRNLVCQQHIISEIASKCDGYDTADLEVLVDRAVHVAARRLLPLLQQTTVPMENDGLVKNNRSIVEGLLEEGNILQNKNQTLQNRSELLEEDFAEAIKDFYPVSMRDVARPADQVKLGWEDVGGLSDTCRVLQEVLELPVKYSKIFSNAPLRLRSGVLLYGPPGCGKTHIVGVAAAACSLRLISVKGPELLNKYIGASEQGVRDIFAKARAAAPCILFFDEFDAIAPKRGHDNTGVTDRVVNQLLTELDGVEALNGVFVFAATSRPELLDAALLRPGRLDRLLLCDLPTAKERLEILKVLSKQLPLAEDVDLYWVASQTENYSGADMQAILIDSQVEAVRNCRDGKSERLIISMDILKSVLAKARASVSKEERNRLHKVYEAFMSSRSSIAKKARDIKGKRATLA